MNLALLFIEDRDGLLPGGALRVVDLAQIEDVSLHHTASERRLSTMDRSDAPCRPSSACCT